MDFNVTAELLVSADRADAVVEQLKDFAAAASPSPAGHLEVVLTIPAHDTRQAATLALSLLAEWPLRTLEVLPTELWDERQEAAGAPASFSVTEVAADLGISRQAVLQRLEAGTLLGTKVGGTWTIPASALAEARRRQSRGERGGRRKSSAARMQPRRLTITTPC